jgi:GntR family transcriptional regulator/MocR family aminotransferase
VELHISLPSRADLSGQIFRQVQAAILDGRLPVGTALPATRELAARLAVSRNTVAAAYDRLTTAGLVSARPRAGTYVSDRPGARRPAPPPGAAARLRPAWRDFVVVPDLTARARYDFRPGLPDARLFPHAAWRRASGQALQREAVRSAPCDPAGLPELRRAVARHVAVARGVQATEEAVVVTNGAQQAFDLVLRTVLEPGATVAVEDPGYPPVSLLLDAHRMRVARVPVDGEGLVVDALPDDARLVYVTPSHQFPYGMPMSLDRRRALLDWADRHDALVLEDDYDAEFRYGGPPTDPLQLLDRAGRVIYVGTFSKVLLPTLRLGFVVSPPWLTDALRAARFVADWHGPLPAQLALTRFIDDGALARHVRRMRAVYRRRHHLVAAAVEAGLRPWLRGVPSDTGLHLAAQLRDGDAGGLSRALDLALGRGVEVYDLVRIGCVGHHPPALVLGYGAIGTADIGPGLAVLRDCLGEALGRR